MSYLCRKIINDMKMLDQNIQRGINKLIEDTRSGLLREDKYILFYMIQENFRMNLYSFESTILEYDYFGFMTPKRNTRSSIETYLDLYNWIKDSRYIEVIKYNSRDDLEAVNDEFTNIIDEYKIGRYKSKGGYKMELKNKIDMYDKRIISFKLGQSQYALDKFERLTKEYNKYVHPNIFIQGNKSEESLRELLIVNIEIYTNAYRSLSRYVYGSEVDNISNEMMNLIEYIGTNSLIKR